MIDHSSIFSVAWTSFDILCCLVSSYIYIWLCAFGDDVNSDTGLFLQIFFEVIFSISMVLKFLTDYIPHGETKPERDLFKLSQRYLYGQFILDLIPLLPLTLLFRGHHHKFKLLFLLKLIRLTMGL